MEPTVPVEGSSELVSSAKIYRVPMEIFSGMELGWKRSLFVRYNTHNSFSYDAWQEQFDVDMKSEYNIKPEKSDLPPGYETEEEAFYVSFERQQLHVERHILGAPLDISLQPGFSFPPVRGEKQPRQFELLGTFLPYDLSQYNLVMAREKEMQNLLKSLEGIDLDHLNSNTQKIVQQQVYRFLHAINKSLAQKISQLYDYNYNRTDSRRATTSKPELINRDRVLRSFGRQLTLRRLVRNRLYMERRNSDENLDPQTIDIDRPGYPNFDNLLRELHQQRSTQLRLNISGLFYIQATSLPKAILDEIRGLWTGVIETDYFNKLKPIYEENLYEGQMEEEVLDDDEDVEEDVEVLAEKKNKLQPNYEADVSDYKKEPMSTGGGDVVDEDDDDNDDDEQQQEEIDEDEDSMVVLDTEGQRFVYDDIKHIIMNDKSVAEHLYILQNIFGEPYEDFETFDEFLKRKRDNKEVMASVERTASAILKIAQQRSTSMDDSHLIELGFVETTDRNKVTVSILRYLYKDKEMNLLLREHIKTILIPRLETTKTEIFVEKKVVAAVEQQQQQQQQQTTTKQFKTTESINDWLRARKGIKTSPSGDIFRRNPNINKSESENIRPSTGLYTEEKLE
jgi:hypothetical protein